MVSESPNTRRTNMSACYRPALVAAVLLAAVPAFAAPRPAARGVISLNSRVIDVARPPAAPEALRADAGTRGAEYLLVKFPGPVTAEQKAALAAAARRIYTYLPENAFLVRMDETPDRAERLARAGAAWSGALPPALQDLALRRRRRGRSVRREAAAARGHAARVPGRRPPARGRGARTQGGRRHRGVAAEPVLLARPPAADAGRARARARGDRAGARGLLAGDGIAQGPAERHHHLGGPVGPVRRA